MQTLAIGLFAAVLGQAQLPHPWFEPGWYVRPPGIIDFAGKDHPPVSSKLECEVIARALSYAEGLDERPYYCSHLTKPVLP